MQTVVLFVPDWTFTVHADLYEIWTWLVRESLLLVALGFAILFLTFTAVKRKRGAV